MSDCIDTCHRLVQAVLSDSQKARTLLDAIRVASVGKEKVEIECIKCEDSSDHVAIYDRSGQSPSVPFGK